MMQLVYHANYSVSLDFRDLLERQLKVSKAIGKNSNLNNQLFLAEKKGENCYELTTTLEHRDIQWQNVCTFVTTIKTINNVLNLDCEYKISYTIKILGGGQILLFAVFLIFYAPPLLVFLLPMVLFILWYANNTLKSFKRKIEDTISNYQVIAPSEDVGNS